MGETYNLGGGETASVWDILHMLEKILGKKAQTRIEPARARRPASTFADTGKLLRHLGWRAQTGLDEGLRKQVEWQRTAHPV